MENALIALLGVLVGILCNEHFRRRNRIEFYSQKVFEKRLKVYEDLFCLFQKSYTVICDVMENEELTEEERHELTSAIILPLCEFTDANEFYLDRYLTVQVATTYMGAEDVLSFDNEAERKSAKAKICNEYALTKKMIIKDSGATEVFKHFKEVSKSKPDSDVIRRVKELEQSKV